MLSRMILGAANPEGTRRFAKRFPALEAKSHFRSAEGVKHIEQLWLSSLGLGTYLGDADDATDDLYRESVKTALRNGVNVVDTAINYRHQRSERAIGRAIKDLVSAGEFNRHEFLVCSKAGYLAFDSEVPADPAAYFGEEYVEQGFFKRCDVAGRMHCMAPRYLENQLERSRANLGLETIDVYYVHNPEAQLADITREEFDARLRAAFAVLEQSARANKIRWYGVASWNAFRVPAATDGWMSLERCVELAKEVGGAEHHFRFVQAPFNMAMTEAHTVAVQPIGKHWVSLLAAAQKLGIAVIGSASLYQSQLTHGLPRWVGESIGMSNDAERALQFARSAPGLLTALVGMAHPEHVLENVKVAQEPPMDAESWAALFQHC